LKSIGKSMFRSKVQLILRSKLAGWMNFLCPPGVAHQDIRKEESSGIAKLP
jgi:hypothetical protein